MMRIVCGTGFLLIAIAFLASPAAADTKPSAGLPLAELVRQVKVALLRVSEDAQNQSLPPLEGAELEVKSTLEKAADGKLNFYIVEVGGSGSSAFASTVTLRLKPPKPDTPSDIAPADLSDALVEAILAGSKAIAAARQGNPPLVADKLVAAVNFVVKRDGSGKIGIDFPPITIGGGIGIMSEAVQTITLTYAVPPPGN